MGTLEAIIEEQKKRILELLEDRRRLEEDVTDLWRIIHAWEAAHDIDRKAV